MNERMLQRSLLRSPVALPSLLGIVALSILTATPPVGASGGDIDNDSPYNMPAFGDSSGGGGGGTMKVSLDPQIDPNGRYANGKISMIVPNVEVGGVFEVVEKLEPRPFAVVPGAKIVPPGSGPSPSVPSVMLKVGPGATVRARDSAPFAGDDTVEIQGSFVLQGVQELVLSPYKQFMQLTGFLMIGDASGYSPTGLMPAVEQIIPLGVSDSAMDVAAIAQTLAKSPQFHGRDAQIIVGHKKWAPGFGVTFEIDAVVDFKVAARPTYQVTTEPKLDF